MRFVYLIFFLLLGIHSQFVFSQEPPPDPVCSSRSVQSACTDMQNVSGSTLSYFNSLCYSQPGRHQAIEPPTTSCEGGRMSIVCYSQCSCPDGFDFKTSLNPITGVKSSGCFPSGEGDGGGVPGDECTYGVNPLTGLCNSDDSCPSGFPKVDGNCPVCLEGYNDDGTCNYPSSEPSASSSPDTGSSGSAGSAASSPGNGGDGDGGGDGPGGGGDGSGNGGDNNGGGGSSSFAGSASSSNNSWNPYSGYGNWIPVSADSYCPNKYQDVSGQWWCAGGSGTPASSGDTGSSGSAVSAANECDSTSANYFSCINQRDISGGTGWNPHQSYGGWLPVNEDSPCVNKYQDANGQWWCAAPTGGGGGGGSGSGGGSASSVGSSGSGGSEGSASSVGSLSSSSQSSSSSSCSASSVSSGASANNPCSGGGGGSASSSFSFSSLGEKGEFDGEAGDKALEDVQDELASKIDDIKEDIKNEFASSIKGSGTIEDFCKEIRGKEVCFGLSKFQDWLGPISQAIFLLACVLSFAIVMSGRGS